MKEKFYLGLSLGFNGSACLMSNTRGLLMAISQERLNGEKNTKKVAFDAIKKCLLENDVTVLDGIAVSHYEEITNEYFEKYSDCDIAADWKKTILRFVNKIGISVKDNLIVRVPHHTAHALSTFGFYGFPKTDNYYTITSDGFGDGFSGVIRDNKSIISSVKLENSIALVYQFVTGALGFKEHQHEGKITGLAAFGEPIYLSDFERLYDIVDDELSFKADSAFLTDEDKEAIEKSKIIDFDKFLILKRRVYELVDDLINNLEATREDIAASVQEFAEKWTLKWITKYCKKADAAYLAGGLFANVKINQRIKDLGLFDNVYVCPAMGDEGTCVGATISLMQSLYDDISDNIDDVGMSKKVISGTSVDGDEDTYECMCYLINKKRLQDDLRITLNRNIYDTIEFISNALSDNKIVCLMRDKMEFGPRALCHRSILYNCNSKDTNDWLNKKLGRTEFMPFAPVCRECDADDLFRNLDGGRDSAKFMTMTFDCTDEFIENYPAACHIDNTARPQIVHREDDPFMWQILTEYRDKTCLKALINTSFNLHNNPIIESELVGFESWLTSGTDILVIGNVIIERVK